MQPFSSNELLIILACCIAWYAIGYLFWRAVHYGAIKYWYLQYKQDYSKSASSLSWVKSMPIICMCGPLNIPISFISGLWSGISFKHGITMHFKVPPCAPPTNP